MSTVCNVHVILHSTNTFPNIIFVDSQEVRTEYTQYCKELTSSSLCSTSWRTLAL